MPRRPAGPENFPVPENPVGHGTPSTPENPAEPGKSSTPEHSAACGGLVAAGSSSARGNFASPEEAPASAAGNFAGHENFTPPENSPASAGSSPARGNFAPPENAPASAAPGLPENSPSSVDPGPPENSPSPVDPGPPETPVEARERAEAQLARLFEATGARSLKHLAGLLGVSPARVSKARREGRIPLGWMARLRALDINPEWLETGAGVKYLPAPMPRDHAVAFTGGADAWEMRWRYLGDTDAPAMELSVARQVLQNILGCFPAQDIITELERRRDLMRPPKRR